MIVYLKGHILNREPGRIFLNTGNIGYAIYLDIKTERLLGPIGSLEELYIAQIIRDNEQKLYGFNSLLKLEVFELLISANKVGPKTAINFLSSLEPENIVLNILNKEAKAFGKISGAGPKTIAQVILDCEKKALRLAEKYQLKIDLKTIIKEVKEPQVSNHNKEVVEALKKLGFTNSEINKSLEYVLKNKPPSNIEEIITACLAYFYSLRV